MSRWNGKMGKGAAKAVRVAKREEAEERNSRTAPHRSRAYRREHGLGVKI